MNPVPAQTKICSKCGENKEISLFSRRKDRPCNCVPACKECEKKRWSNWQQKNTEYNRKRSKNWRDKFPEKRKEYVLKAKHWIVSRYGITFGEKIKIWESQHKSCCFCKKPLPIESRDTCIDHDHKITKKRLFVRGILCNDCNFFLMCYEKSKEWISIPLFEEYLNNPPAQKVLRELDKNDIIKI